MATQKAANPHANRPIGDLRTLLGVRSYRGLTLTLEDKLTLGLLAAGWEIMDASAKPTTLHDRIIVRQLRPRVLDAVTQKVRQYRLDFAHPQAKVALEADGYSRIAAPVPGQRPVKANGKGGHITWAGFHNDRERDRNLTLGGWRVLRCGPDDLKTPARTAQIVAQFIRLIDQLTPTSTTMEAP